MCKILVQILPHGEGLPLPALATAGAAGWDVRAAVSSAVVIPPMGRAMIPTGLAVALPDGWELQVRPRSGLAWKHGITQINAPGTIDADYRGELCVLLVNLGDAPFTVARGDRVAQLVVAPVWPASWEAVAELPPTGRGAGGFGSTGQG